MKQTFIGIGSIASAMFLINRHNYFLGIIIGVIGILCIRYGIQAIFSTSRKKGMLLKDAIKSGDIQLAQLLIKKGADLNVKDTFGCTALHDALDRGYLEISELLIEKGTDVNAQKNKGYTTLHYTLEKGYLQIAELLIKRGGRDRCKGGWSDSTGLCNRKGLSQFDPTFNRKKRRTKPKKYL